VADARVARRTAHVFVFSVLIPGARTVTQWLKFFFVRLPLAVIAVALVVEAMAALLTGVTLHRHNVDDLANAVTRDTHSYRVVLLGDSVTHNVAHKYRIGNANEVADLTTHALAGLPSSLFLLKRYVESGHRPQHVVVAASRGVFIDPMDKSMFKYYVSSVFTLPYEREFLERYYGGYLNHHWTPAALSMTTRLGEPLFSLIRRPGNDIWIAPETPSAHPTLDTFPTDILASPNDEAWFQKRIDGPATISPEARAILAEMCQLSHQYGFSLHLVWAPVETRLHHALQANGKVQSINDQLAAIFKANQTVVSIDDADDKQDYPYFDRDLIHIRGLGWEQTYANQLTSYIYQYEAQPRR
jgi:hypothetical protein